MIHGWYWSSSLIAFITCGQCISSVPFFFLFMVFMKLLKIPSRGKALPFPGSVEVTILCKKCITCNPSELSEHLSKFPWLLIKLCFSSSHISYDVSSCRCDRSYALPEAKRCAVAQETLAVWCSLASKLGEWALKAELEDLCFAVLNVSRLYLFASAISFILDLAVFPLRAYICHWLSIVICSTMSCFEVGYPAPTGWILAGSISKEKCVDCVSRCDGRVVYTEWVRLGIESSPTYEETQLCIWV